MAEDGEFRFELLPWHPSTSSRITDLADEIARRFPLSEHFLVIDGPQALAALGNNRRQCEALTRTPARTPDALPDADGRPFAGYVRGSILLWRELIRSGWRVAETRDQIQPGRIAEAYPGDAWRRLSPHRLPSKGTAPGRAARLDLLRQLGLRFPAEPLPTHDQLDAALCAALAYWSRHGGRTVELVGEPLREEDGALREGYILSPTREIQERRGADAALRSAAKAEAQAPPRTDGPGPPDLSAKRSRRNAAAEQSQLRHRPLGPEEVWVYFAHASQADQATTFEIIVEEEVVWRPAANSVGHAIANLRRIKPGDPLVVVHSQSMLGTVLGTADGTTLLPFDPFPRCVAKVPEGSTLRTRFLAAGYQQREPVTVLVVEDVEPLPDDLEVPVQRGRNAIQRVTRPDLLEALQDK